MKRVLAAWTDTTHPYPNFINISEDLTTKNVTIVIRSYEPSAENPTLNGITIPSEDWAKIMDEIDNG